MIQDYGTFVKNFQEHPQSIILTDSLEPVLEQGCDRPLWSDCNFIAFLSCTYHTVGARYYRALLWRPHRCPVA
jgi:hypothetical protein